MLVVPLLFPWVVTMNSVLTLTCNVPLTLNLGRAIT